MTARPTFDTAAAVPAGAAVLGVPVFSDLGLPDGAGAEIDAGYMRQRRFEGRPGQALPVLADDGTTVVALGVGERGGVDPDALRRAGAALARNAGAAGHVATTLTAALGGPEGSAAVVEGFALGSYRYEAAPRRLEADGAVERVTVVGGDGEAVRRAEIVSAATCRARDWVNRPPRHLTPEILAGLAAEAAGGLGVAAEIW